MKTRKFTIPVVFFTMLLSYTSFFANAQVEENAKSSSKIQISIAVGALQTTPSANATEREVFYSPSQFFLGDIEHKFQSKWNAYLGANVHIAILNRIKIKSGIIGQFDRFNYTNSEVNNTRGVFAIKTLNGENNIFNQASNFYSAIAKAQQKTSKQLEYQAIQLQVPIGIQYQILQRVAVEGGVFLQMPVWSKSTRYLPLITEVAYPSSGGTYFKGSSMAVSDEPAVGLAHFTGGALAGLNYQFGHFALEASYGQTFINYFKNIDRKDNSDYANYNAKVFVNYLRLGLQCTL